MKRVLVTGATGFIGRHCLNVLQGQDFEVHALSFQNELANMPKIVWHRLDLHDHAAVKELLATIRPQALLHSAWYVEHGLYWSSEENLRWVASSLNLVRHFMDYGGEKLVCVGTSAEYDWSEPACLKSLSEALAPLKPHTLYGASKASLYMTIENLSAEKGISFAWARLFNPYGSYDNPKRLIPYTVLSLLRGEVATCNNPELVRNFTYVEDVARILVALINSEITGAINVANEQPVKLKHVVESIAKLLDAKNLIEYKANSGTTTEPISLIADITKLKNKLPLIALTSLDQGLEKTVAWWQDQVKPLAIT